MKNNALLFCFFLMILVCRGQNPINAYASVTAISGTTLTVSNVNETFHSFEDGDYVVIMQMQDDVIGTNTTNASSFGDLGALQSAGLYEIVRILSHTEVSSLPNSIVLSSSLLNTYNINANASVQLITLRFLGTNFTSTANIGTLAWNGTIGGVTAMSVTGVFNLGHNISANGAGFTGGLRNSPNGYTTCDNTTYATTVATRFAGKGEGIYKITNSAFGGARGKVLNGGGGGNDVNAGGGGGANYSAGGTAGSGWTPTGVGCSPISGGLGGLSLGSFIAGYRVFMGGGGGGGHQNDGNGTVGGAGGGIILLRTGTLQTTTCSGISISANGVSAATALNDGAGGGGAGGTIVLHVGTYSIASTCSLVISSNGGNGGNSNLGATDAHGGGGGGGQGAIIYSGAQPTANVTASTVPGSGGVSCNGCGSSVNGSVGGGTVNAGVITFSPGPLPVELIDFTAKLDSWNQVRLNWHSAVESGSQSYRIERMNEQMELIELGEVKTKGSYNSYLFVDEKPNEGINYYRLKTVEADGAFSAKHWIEIAVDGTAQEMTIYPNPVNEEKILNIRIGGVVSNASCEIFSASSQLIRTADVYYNTATKELKVDVDGLSPGIYILKLKVNNRMFYKKFVISPS